VTGRYWRARHCRLSASVLAQLQFQDALELSARVQQKHDFLPGLPDGQTRAGRGTKPIPTGPESREAEWSQSRVSLGRLACAWPHRRYPLACPLAFVLRAETGSRLIAGHA